jgi:putative membrane protein
MKKQHLLLLLVNLALILGFGAIYIARMNYEFVIYVSVIIFFLILIGLTLRKVDYTLGALVGLTVWSALHLAGGIVPVGDGRLYDIILIPLSNSLPILRYDQFVHIWGFGASTLVIYCLLSRSIRKPIEHPVALGIVIVMGGLGIGAFNEIVEFAVTLVVPESGVGGYMNTSLDLCADLAGAVLGLVYVRVRYWKISKETTIVE